MVNVIREIFHVMLDMSDAQMDEWGLTVKGDDNPDSAEVEKEFSGSLSQGQREMYEKLARLSGFEHLDECGERFEQGFRIGFSLASSDE